MLVKTDKRDKRKIEHHLRNYKTYKVAIKNLQQQLDYIMPNMTASYELKESSTGTFSIKSSTEEAVLDRLESARALHLHEQIKLYHLTINAIDEALGALGEQERKFIQLRYFEGWTIEKTADELHCSVQNAFKIRNHAMDKFVISLKDVSRVFVEFL